MKTLKKKSIISLILTFIMIFNVVPFGAITSYAAGTISYSLSTSQLDLGNIKEGYTQPENYSRTFKIKNTSTDTTFDTYFADTSSFVVGGIPNGMYLNPNGELTISVRPKPGLTAGIYNEQIKFELVDQSDGTNREVFYFPVSATVYKDTTDFTVTPSDITFTSQEVGYTSYDLKEITIENTGTVNLNYGALDSSSFTVNGLTGRSATPGEKITFEIERKRGLPKGTYNETITVEGVSQSDSTKVSKTINLSFTVTEAGGGTETVNMSVTPSNVTFTSQEIGYTGNDWEEITIENTGSETLNLYAANSSSFTVNGLTGRYVTPGEKVTFEINRKTGLPKGTYNETITVEGISQSDSTKKVSKTINVSFTVTDTAPTQHPVTFVLNGGTMAGTNPVMVDDGGKVTKPTPNPTKTGLVFDNWYSDATFTTLFDFDTPIINPTPIYANWYGIITVNASTGGKVNINNLYFPDTNFTENVWEGKTMTLQAISDSGYKFVKWVKDSPTGTLVSTNANTSITVDSSKTYYAIFEPETTTQHTVTFELNGGTMTGTNPVKVNEGGKVTQPADPTRTGYYFEGWYKESTFNNRFEFTTETISGNTSIYAKWLPKVVGMDLKTEGTEMNGANYRLKVKSLDVNFHTSATPVTIDSKVVSDLHVDNTGTTPLTTAPVAGTTYYFTVMLAAGDDYIPKVFWDDAMKTGSVGTATNATIGYSDLFRSPGSGSAMILFTYKELSQPVNIAVDYNGGTNNGFVSSPLEKGSVINKSDVEASLNSPLVTPPTNKEFDYLEIDGVKWTSDTYTVNSDITVKIIWKDKAVTQHTVTFFNDEGGVISSTNVNSGEKVTRPSTDPTKAGYRFDDWYTDGLYNTKFVFDNPITIDTRIYAKFDKEYNILITDGGPDKTVAIYGELVSITADPAPSGKEFDKWVVEEGTISLANANNSTTTFTMPESNVKVTATYKDKAVTPTYTIESGANQTYIIDSNVDVKIKASGDKAKLDRIEVDGTVLDSTKYKTEPGSTILTLFPSYLNSLTEGEHTVKFVYNDGEVSTGLKIAKNNSSGGNTGGNTTGGNTTGGTTGGNTSGTNNENSNTNTNTTGTNTSTSTSSKTPKTGDNITLWIVLSLVATLGLAGTVKYLRKRD